jgi:quercetin dioxygenase-like cupin family protein
MQITRIGIETATGSSDWFTGAVFVDAVAAPAGGSRLSASTVHFTPGARTHWHTHPNGQTIYVLEGIGLAQRRGGPVEVIRPGDRVFFEPGEEHWHGLRRPGSWPTSPCSRSTTRATPRRGESL